MNLKKVWSEKTTRGEGRQWSKSLSSLLSRLANFSPIPTIPSPLKCVIQSLPLISKILAVCQWPAFNFSVRLLNTICTDFSLLSKLGAIAPFSWDRFFTHPRHQNLLPDMFWPQGNKSLHIVRRLSPLVRHKLYSPARNESGERSFKLTTAEEMIYNFYAIKTLELYIPKIKSISKS